MPGLVRIDLAGVLPHVAGVCAAHPEVLAGYVFGSALGPMRPDSDIDVGVILRSDTGRESSPWGCEGPLEEDLGWLGTHPHHVTVFNEAGAIFAVRALSESRLAYVADEAALSDFIERVALLHWQNAWRYWSAVAEVNGWDPRRIRGASPTGPDM